MSHRICLWFKGAFLGLILLAAAVFGGLVEGQSTPPPIHVGGVEITGIPQDWSQNYVMFSNPGTDQEAIQGGRHEHWQRIVNDPRYVLQQMRRNARVQGPAAADAEARSQRVSQATGPRIPRKTPEESGPSEGFWNVPLGNSASGLKAGHYPAKYSFNPNITANCNDYVVFPTGAASSGTQATIVAINNLYSSCTNPSLGTGFHTVFWAYYTGNGQTVTANTSPVLSLDGSQVAYIQTTNTTPGGAGTASLVILKMRALGSPADGTISLPSTALQLATSAQAYRSCAAPCYILLPLNSNDTNSAPFYRYDGSDTLYVGDDSGNLHQFTGVFSFSTGPVEGTRIAVVATTSPVSTAGRLTSPVYDSRSNIVFVSGSTTDAGNCNLRAGVTPTTCGRLYSVNSATGAGGANSNSNVLDCGTGFLDPPLVDSATENIYVFIGSGCDGPSSTNVNRPGNSYINRFTAGANLGGGPGQPSAGFGKNSVSFGNGFDGTNTNSIAAVARIGTFDNGYLSGTTSPPSGHVYACVNGSIYQADALELNQDGVTVPQTTFSIPLGGPNDTLPCSPLTEFFRAGTQDLLFVSIRQGGGNSVVYTYDITTGGNPPTSPFLSSRTVGTGTSGIIIDTNSTAVVGTQQIYFTSGQSAYQADQVTLQ